MSRPKLTEDERRLVSVAKVASSHEVAELVATIERLTGETVPAAEEGSKAVVFRATEEGKGP